ncbi:endonuclease domain-containing protein [Phytoactinopolyspora alkaliphila]|nr:endonuclease domain-containing protein [Phytoactinopolyspora alkaliphila]
MAIQQRLVTGVALADAFGTVKRHRRRRFLRTVLADVIDGVQSMGELDFAGMCRARGLPEPTRQVVRRGPRGRVYLDVYWDQWGVVVEIEGAQHLDPATSINDALRQNELFIHGDGVLRLPVIGLRLEPDAFMNQVANMIARSRRRAA